MAHGPTDDGTRIRDARWACHCVPDPCLHSWRPLRGDRPLWLRRSRIHYDADSSALHRGGPVPLRPRIHCRIDSSGAGRMDARFDREAHYIA